EVFDELVGAVDRLIVDSTEWPDDDLAWGYGQLARRFDRAVVSDIAWARTERWRHELAAAWPFDGNEISVTSTRAQAMLLVGWLSCRVGQEVAFGQEPSDSLVGVYVDGEPIDAPPGEPPPSSELLSDELDRFVRDPIYEAAVRGAAATN